MGRSGGARKDIDVIFFGRLIPGKGIFEFLHVVRRMRSLMGKDVVAVMAGHPERIRYVKELRRRAVNMGLKIDIMPGGVGGRMELMDLVSRSKVFVYPTKLDSVGMVVLEALSCGVPVVTHDIPATRFNFRTRSVIRVPVRDVDSMASAAVHLLINDEERELLGRLGRRFAAKFNWEDVATAEWDALRKVISMWSIEGNEEVRPKAN